MSNYEITKKLSFTSEELTTATCEITIGKVVGVVTFSSIEEDVLMKLCKNIKMLDQAGIDFDFTELEAAYKLMVANKEEIIKAAKIKKYTTEFNKAWYFRKELPTIEGVTYEFETLEDFLQRKLNRSWATVRCLTVVYKGVKTSVTLVSIGGSYSIKGTPKYQVSGTVTSYKNRNYKTVENAIEKIVELTDHSIAIKERKANTKAKRLEMLNAKFGQAIVKSEWESGHRRGQGYSVDIYYICRGEKKFKIEFSRADGLFRFAGLGVLTETQIQSILDIV